MLIIMSSTSVSVNPSTTSNATNRPTPRNTTNHSICFYLQIIYFHLLEFQNYKINAFILRNTHVTYTIVTSPLLEPHAYDIL